MNKTKKKFLYLCLFLCLFTTNASHADWINDDDDGDYRCEPNRKICFTLYCNYKKTMSNGVTKKCEAAAKFVHWVTARGYEVWNESSGLSNPLFEVKCESDFLFSGTGRRFTDHNGTRIQPLNQPFPDVEFPKYSLESGHRTVESYLNLLEGKMEGRCAIYTGTSLHL